MTKLIPGTILQSNNYGEFRVIRDDSSYSVCIEFLSTGYRNIVARRNAKRGMVKDVLLANVCGVGFIGEGPATKGKSRKIYNVWSSILQRCYDPKSYKEKPAYIGITVCPEWLNFRVFEKWYEENHRPGMHIDKDIKVKGNRVYSPKSCSFVTPAANTIEAHAKHYVFLSPSGVRHEIYNLSEFSRDQGLCQSGMSSVHRGRRKHHHGWTQA